MAVTAALKDIDYPESDGQPMGETELHKRWIIRLYDQLGMRFRSERTYVGSDLLMYYEKGNNTKFVVPDVFVVKDCEPGLRKTFQIWGEERVPNVVFEVTSASTKTVDRHKKPSLYGKIGVNELILFDPTSDYLEPALQLYRRIGGQLVRQEPDSNGELLSVELDAKLYLDGDQFVLLDRETRMPFLTEAEAEAQRADTEAQRADVETQRADTEARARARLEAEVERLREIMRQNGLRE